jgi:seryl-tRNA synthetase
MLDIQRIRDNPEQIKMAASNKKSPIDIQAITNLDSRRRDIIKEVEILKNLRNTRTQEIAILKKDKKDASTLIDEMKKVSDTIKEYRGIAQ